MAVWKRTVQPFGAECIVAVCCQRGEEALNELKEKLIAVFNGLAADNKYLMVSEYGCYGSDAEIVVFKRWN